MAVSVHAALALGLAAAMSACAEPGAGRPAETAQHVSTWREPAAYTFTVESECGERNFLGRYRIAVAAGKVVKVEGMDEPARRSLAAGPADLAPTLAGLVDELAEARKEGADVARLESDPADQHPTRITIDPDRTAIDDEACYTISDYRPQ